MLTSRANMLPPCEVNHFCAHRYMITLWCYRDDYTRLYHKIWLYDCRRYGGSWALVVKPSAIVNCWNLFAIVNFELVEGKYDPFNDVEMIFEGDAGGMSVSSYVLALASPVFRAMLTSDMFEDKSTYNTHQTIIAARVTGPTWAAPAYLWSWAEPEMLQRHKDGRWYDDAQWLQY